jgi:hypothetical protein
MPKKIKFEDPTFDNPPTGGSETPSEPGDDLPPSKVGVVLQQHEARLMAIPGVKSIGEGRGPVGDPVIEVGIAHPGVAESVPHSLGGIEVVTRVIGEVDAYGKKSRRGK